MRKIFGCLLLVCIFITIFVRSNVFAVISGSTSSGWDIFTADASYPSYRYGPSMIVDGRIIDMCTSTPGEVSGEWDWIRHKRSTDG